MTTVYMAAVQLLLSSTSFGVTNTQKSSFGRKQQKEKKKKVGLEDYERGARVRGCPRLIGVSKVENVYLHHPHGLFTPSPWSIYTIPMVYLHHPHGLFAP